MYIKREDAIKAIDDLPNCYNGWSDAYDKAYIIGTLEEVPAVEPTIDKDELIRLIQGAVYDGEDCAKLMAMVEPYTEKMIVDGEEIAIDPVSYEVGYTRGQMAERKAVEPSKEWLAVKEGERNALKEMFEQMVEPKWIPCEERLPKIGEVVLVTWEWGCKKYITIAYMVTIRGVTYWDSKLQHEYKPLNVVAWMPLPEPWEGADDE